MLVIITPPISKELLFPAYDDYMITQNASCGMKGLSLAI